MKILVIGATGMLGHTLYEYLSGVVEHEVYATVRHATANRFFSEHLHPRLLSGVNILDVDSVIQVMNQVRPDVVINCAGLIKQLADAENPLIALPINALFPHRLAALCQLSQARLIHISTDCVFRGDRGAYTETEPSDAADVYGKSKHLGEVIDQPHAITLRTSIIGHELNSSHALVNWFLSQTESVKGYSKAIFSGLPTIELARLIQEYVLPAPNLSGLYHVAANPISKFDLLELIAKQYQKETEIIQDDLVQIDRSLNGSRFEQATGYSAPDWPHLIESMFREYHNHNRHV